MREGNARVHQVIQIAAQKVLQGCCRAAVRDVQRKDARLRLEHLTCDVRAGAVAGRAVAHFAGVAFGISNEFGISLVGGIAAHHQKQLQARTGCDGDQVFVVVKGHFGRDIGHDGCAAA